MVLFGYLHFLSFSFRLEGKILSIYAVIVITCLLIKRNTLVSSSIFIGFNRKMADTNRTQRKLSTAGQSLYVTLGLEKGASAEDLKKAYRCVI